MTYRRSYFNRNGKPFRSFRDDKIASDADGVDAIKDANAMLGNRPYDRDGEQYAREQGWIKENDDE